MIYVILGVLAVLIVAAVWYGGYRWDAGTKALHARLAAARVPFVPEVFDAAELRGLPAPVQRYFRAVLQDGQPMVTAVHLEHSGTFNMGEAADQWRPFTSDQVTVTRRPGFDWNGRITLMPGVSVRVHDAYVAGEGILSAAVFGLITVADLRGGREIARGELLRFFAEAAWYPTALLPSQGVRWEAVDDRAARATLSDGELTVTLLFRFDARGLIDTVHADARGRTVGGEVVPTPWQGRFWQYASRDGMLVPLEGEVAWLLQDGAKPYWRGRVTACRYEFAR